MSYRENSLHSRKKKKKKKKNVKPEYKIVLSGKLLANNKKKKKKKNVTPEYKSVQNMHVVGFLV